MANEPRQVDRSDDASARTAADRRRALGFAEGETWFDAIDDLLDASIERDEEFVCAFDGFEVDVPVRMGEDAPRARWRLDGTVAVSVEGTRGPLAEWLQWWSRRVA
ncbi:MAG: hypothetical protein ABEH47_00535 [Haloferacaceae archaeon]